MEIMEQKGRDRKFTKPTTLAECVGGIMIEDGRVLVEKRRANDEADPGLVVLPGGHVDKRESLTHALRREMREELGIEVEKMKPVLTRIYTASNGERQRIHYFRIEKWKGNIKSKEAERVYWESLVSNLHDAQERKVVSHLLNQRSPLRFELSKRVSNDALNSLYSLSWPRHRQFDFKPILKQSLAYACAFQAKELVGFVYLAWDGSHHAFLLEPTVTPRLRRRGIGKELVQRVVEEARRRGLDWVHTDYEPTLAGFYRACGFVPTRAGLIALKQRPGGSKQVS